jgi:hypothetical protein
MDIIHHEPGLLQIQYSPAMGAMALLYSVRLCPLKKARSFYLPGLLAYLNTEEPDRAVKYDGFLGGGETPSLHPSAGQANYSELESVMNIVTVRSLNTSLRLRSTTICENIVKVKPCRAIGRRLS